MYRVPTSVGFSRAIPVHIENCEGVEESVNSNDVEAQVTYRLSEFNRHLSRVVWFCTDEIGGRRRRTKPAVLVCVHRVERISGIKRYAIQIQILLVNYGIVRQLIEGKFNWKIYRINGHEALVRKTRSRYYHRPIAKLNTLRPRCALVVVAAFSATPEQNFPASFPKTIEWGVCIPSKLVGNDPMPKCSPLSINLKRY